MADELGVDALGFVFVAASSRCVSPSQAANIIKHLSPFVTVVGLFLNADAKEVEAALDHLPSMVPQFHGQESAAYCDGFNRPYIKALGVGSAMPSTEELAQFRLASGFLFDSNEPGALGGTGHTFDWTRMGAKIERPLILAGGISVQNVEDAIEQVAPHALDVSSGVESAKGVKCPMLMQQFMQAVSEADARRNPRNNE